MNFKVESILASGGRLGRIIQTTQGKTVTIETPTCTLFTKGGSAPYLSLSMLEKVKNVPDFASMSVNAFVEHTESLRESGKKLSEFTSMQNKLVFSTLHDASLPLQSGKNEKSGVAVWGRGGKTMLNPGVYMKLQETLQPDWILALSDGDTDKESTEKRSGKAVDRTLDFLDEIVSAREKSQILKNTSLIGAVVGGFSERQRQRSATETAMRPVDGFLIEGFQKGNSEEKLVNDHAFQKTLTKILSHLPEGKPRIMETPWSPLQVTHVAELGIDVFSSAYPHTLGEKGFAMAEDYSLSPSPNSTGEEKEQEGDSNTTQSSILDLNDKRYFEDFTPVLQGCQCYTCATFTRSYIHHLLNTSELLAHVLLTIHNFERYFLFFQTLRESIKNDRLSELQNKLAKQERNAPEK